MNIYQLISNIKDVKSRKCVSRNNESRDKEKGSKGTNGCTGSRIRQCKEYNVCVHEPRGTSKTRKAFGISLPKFKFYSTSSYSQKAWSKGKNLLILLSLFYMPFIVNNLTYFMLLDFSVIGYDIQSFNNLGVYR